MGKHALLTEILQNNEKMFRIKEFVKMFGIRAAGRKWNVTEYIINQVINFKQEVKA